MHQIRRCSHTGSTFLTIIRLSIFAVFHLQNHFQHHIPYPTPRYPQNFTQLPNRLSPCLSNPILTLPPPTPTPHSAPQTPPTLPPHSPPNARTIHLQLVPLATSTATHIPRPQLSLPIAPMLDLQTWLQAHHFTPLPRLLPIAFHPMKRPRSTSPLIPHSMTQ